MKYLLLTDCANIGVGKPGIDEKVKPNHFKVYDDIQKLKEDLQKIPWYKGEAGTKEEKEEYLNSFFLNICNMDLNKLVKIENITLNSHCCQYFIYIADEEPENVKLTLDDIKTMFN